jgi:hypothetical protein
VPTRPVTPLTYSRSSPNAISGQLPVNHNLHQLAVCAIRAAHRSPVIALRLDTIALNYRGMILAVSRSDPVTPSTGGGATVRLNTCGLRQLNVDLLTGDQYSGVQTVLYVITDNIL